MAHTVKWEHRSDSFHTNHRDERRARPGGARAQAFQADLDLDDPRDTDQEVTR